MSQWIWNLPVFSFRYILLSLQHMSPSENGPQDFLSWKIDQVWWRSNSWLQFSGCFTYIHWSMSFNKLGSAASLEFSSSIHARLESIKQANPLVYTKKSWITSADEGLFARRSIRHGDVITCYIGEKLPTKIAIKRKDKSYLMRLGMYVSLSFFLSLSLSLVLCLSLNLVPSVWSLLFHNTH